MTNCSGRWIAALSFRSGTKQGHVLRSIPAHLEPLRISTWGLPAVQQVVVNVWTFLTGGIDAPRQPTKHF